MLADLALRQLDFPKHDGCARPRLSLHSDVYQDISRLVEASVSPVHSESPTLDEDRLSSPTSPSGLSPSFHYATRQQSSFDSPVSPAAYEPDQTHYSYESVRLHNPQNYSQPAVSSLRESDQGASYLSDSPSPVDVHSSTAFHQPLAIHDRFPSESPYPPAHISDRRLESTRFPSLPGNTSYPSSSYLLDQRRMSEPAVHYPLPSMTGAVAYDGGAPESSHHSASRSADYQQREPSLRDMRHHQYQPMDHPAAQTDSGWRPADGSQGAYRNSLGLEEPLSPYHSNFPGPPIHGSPSENVPWSAASESHYDSPPGTGHPPASPDSDSKRYSFVALPGNAVKKRPRRRYDEIERLYQCSWPDCNKAYGTLNHLNAHVTMQKHGPKRNPNEFKELRKQWRKAKKEADFAPDLPRGGDHDLYDSRYGHRHAPYSYPSPTGPPPASDLPYPGDRAHGHRVGERISYDERERFPPSGHTWSPDTFSRSSAPFSTVPFPPLTSIVPPPHHNLHSVNSPHLRSEYHRELSPPRLGRLPANSTLLTPLANYQPSGTLLPPLEPRVDLEYGAEGYYDEERGRRPDPGHAPLGCSGDEYR